MKNWLIITEAINILYGPKRSDGASLGQPCYVFPVMRFLILLEPMGKASLMYVIRQPIPVLTTDKLFLIFRNLRTAWKRTFTNVKSVKSITVSTIFLKRQQTKCRCLTLNHLCFSHHQSSTLNIKNPKKTKKNLTIVKQRRMLNRQRPGDLLMQIKMKRIDLIVKKGYKFTIEVVRQTLC